MTTLEQKERYLSQSNEYIAKAEEIIVEQRERIKRRSSTGYDTTQSKKFLAVFNETLQYLQKHRERLVNEVETLLKEMQDDS